MNLKWYQTEASTVPKAWRKLFIMIKFEDDPGKKKKKKKKQRDGDIKPAIVVPRMRIVDTDVDVSQTTV